MVGVIFILVLLAAIAAGADSPSPHQSNLVYSEGRVSAELSRVPLGEVIALLAHQAGVEFHGELRDAREVSARFDRTRFRDAVDRLVGDQNFTITYDASGRPYRVDLWGMPQSATRFRPRVTSDDFGRLMVQHPPVLLPSVLVESLHARTAPLPWLLRRGARHREAAVRSATAALFVRTVDGAPALQRAMQRADDQTIGMLLRTWAGTGVAEVVGAVAARARDPLLRNKARRVLNHLKAVATARGVPPS